MNKRQDPFRLAEQEENIPALPDIYDNLRLAQPRKRNRRWEKEHNSRKAVYRSVDPKLALRVKQLAGEFEVREGEVARFLLEYALRAYNAGELDLIPYPNPNRMRMTLFPAEEPFQRADLAYTSRKTRRKKAIGASWKVITTWRNFPPELKSEISDLASEAGLDVPVGELVTALLRFSLTAYELGLLIFNPVQFVSGYQLEERGAS
jgi:hypothetical protein